MSDEVSVVRRYYEIVGDLGSSAEDLRSVLHPDVQIHEHPNAISPRGSVRNRDESVAAFVAGKDPTWRGTLAHSAGTLPAGRELVAQVAALLTVKDGLIRRHETFDCYEPF